MYYLVHVMLGIKFTYVYYTRGSGDIFSRLVVYFVLDCLCVGISRLSNSVCSFKSTYTNVALGSRSVCVLYLYCDIINYIYI